MLESGVDVNVIRGWLGYVSLDTTNRYAEISIRMKQEALEACQLLAYFFGGTSPKASLAYFSNGSPASDRHVPRVVENAWVSRPRGT
ncbi:hypothetical protein NKI28_32215 [Mesorhizobium sp. M0895]